MRLILGCLLVFAGSALAAAQMASKHSAAFEPAALESRHATSSPEAANAEPAGAASKAGAETLALAEPESPKPHQSQATPDAGSATGRQAEKRIVQQPQPTAKRRIRTSRTRTNDLDCDGFNVLGIAY